MSLFYRSEYVNLVLTGRTRTGEPFALVAGKHSVNYPYAHAESGWDDVLITAGGRKLAVWSRSLPDLHIELDPPDAPRGRFRVRWSGAASDASGARADLALDLRGIFVRFHPFQLAKRYNLFDSDWAPGLRWQPFQLAGGEGQSVTVDGEPVALEATFGELEAGRVFNVASRRFAFGYDYLCAARAGDDAYAFVRFVSQAVEPTGLFGRLLDAYLRWSASETLTIQAGGIARGDRVGAPGLPDADPSAVLVRHAIPLGYADLDRRLVTATDSSGRATFGLRELFAPRPAP